MDIHVESQGCNETARVPGPCGRAYISVNGKNRSPHERGGNVVILDGATGKFIIWSSTPSQRGHCLYIKRSTWLFANMKQLSNEIYFLFHVSNYTVRLRFFPLLRWRTEFVSLSLDK